MTLREITLDIMKDDPMCSLVTLFQFLRSVVQRERATYEGVAASINKWKEINGEITGPKVRAWIEKIPSNILDKEIPESIIKEYLLNE